MKNILLMLVLLIAVSLPLAAQTDKIDRLSDKVDKLSDQMAELAKQQAEFTKQMIELAKQQAVTNTEIKNLDKRLDVQTMYIFAILAGIFGVIALTMWDKRTITKPFEEKANELKIAIALLQEKELKLEERELKHEEKTEAFFKKIAQIDARFASIL